VDSKQTVPTWQRSDGELTAALLRAQKNLNQQYGHSIHLAEEAESRGLASCKGYRTAARFLTSALNLSTREAKARVAYATLPMPLARRELTAGRITCEHIAEIRLTTYWDIDTPPQDPEDRLARPRRRLKYWFATNGQMHFTGQLDRETAHFLEGILTPLAKPRPADEFDQEDPRNEHERNGDALAEAFNHINNAPDVPTIGGDRAVVTVTLEEPERRAGKVLLGELGYSTASHLRRLCCDTKVIPAVLGTKSEILDIGRSHRLASRGQCRALALRDRGCSRPGCRRPPKHCRAHHLIPWSKGGETNIDNMALLCDFQHRELHHTEWSMRMVNGVPEFIPPKYLAQEQKPIRNRMHKAV